MHGDFVNDAAISEGERAKLLRWLNDRIPPGDPAEAHKRPVRSSGWSIPTPNLIVGMPEPFTVPATGTIDYQYVLLDYSFQEDIWVQAAEIRPGNPQVVHHCVVMLIPPPNSWAARNGDVSAATFVVDSLPQLNLEAGQAKRIPAGWRMMFVMHYTPIGSEQTDQTQLGLRVVDAEAVEQEVKTKVLYSTDILIPPGEKHYRKEITHRFDRDVQLLSLFPHMHYRGDSFHYEAIFPDGHTETLLNLKKWDFNWQHNYQFRRPVQLPAGTILQTVGYYDNSADNPANPDPTIWVEQGSQTTNEMFNAYFDYVVEGEPSPSNRTSLFSRCSKVLSGSNRLTDLTSLFAIALAALYGRRFLPGGSSNE